MTGRTAWAGIQVDELPYVWPHIQEYIHAGLQHGLGEYTEEDLVRMLQKKDLQLWVAGDMDDLDILGAAITQIQEGKNMKFLDIFLVAGEGINWPEHIKELEEWGKEKGCSYIKLCGRRGWKKVLAPKGYTEQYVVLSKPLFRSH